MKTRVLFSTLCVAITVSSPTFAQESSPDRPNILVIFGDDIGIANVSAYSDGLMGYTTPNIDSIGEGGIVSSTTTASKAARRAAPRF